MKAMELPKELQSFLEIAETAEEETLSSPRGNGQSRLSSLSEGGPRIASVKYQSAVLRIIETARKEVRAGKTTSLEALEKKFGVGAANKRME